MTQVVYDDRVYEQATVDGTSNPYTLTGALSSYRTFADAPNISDADVVEYFATDGTDFEVGLGTYASGAGTIARTTVLKSSNANAAVNWANPTTVSIGASAGARNFDIMSFGAASPITPPDASGNGSVALGSGAASSGADAFAAGGNALADGDSSFACPGGTAYAPSSFAGPDATTTAGASGGWSFAWGSSALTTASAYGAIAIGDGCTAGKAAAVSYYCHAYGYQALSDIDGMRAFSYGQRAAQGDSQRFDLHLAALTTNATPAPLVVGQDSIVTNDTLDLKDNRVYTFYGSMSCWQHAGIAGSVGDSKSFYIKGSVKRVGGTVTLNGTPVVDDLSVGSALTVSIAISADDVNKRLQIQVTCEADKSVSHNAHLTFNVAG